MTTRSSQYEIPHLFSAGLTAAILCQSRDSHQSPHWMAGWDAGYGLRKRKNELLDEYLVSIGRQPQHRVRLA